MFGKKGILLDYRIVRLTTKDIEQISRIANMGMAQHKSVLTEKEKEDLFSPQKYERAFKNPLGFYYGAFENDKLIGFVAGGFLKNPNASGAFVSECFVLPEYQRHGIGWELFKVLEKSLFEKKKRIWFEGIRENLGFFLKMGYTVKENMQSINKNMIVLEKVRQS